MAQTVEQLQVQQIEGGYLDLYWPAIERELDYHRELWEHDFTKETLLQAVKGGFYQVWAFGTPETIKVVMFTELRDTPITRILHVKLVFGQKLLTDYIDLVDTFLDNLARIVGAKYIEMEGRRGWEKVLSRRGAELVCIRMRRPVRNEQRN